MKLLRRLMARSCFLGLLIAVGWSVFHLVRHRPRLTIAESAAIVHLAADGRWLVTHDVAAGHPCKLKVWDLRTGALARSIPVAGRGVPSTDKTLFAFLEREHPIQIVNWQTGAAWHIPVPARTWDSSLRFSPGGRWLRVLARDQGPGDCIIDLANQTVAWRSAQKFLGFTNDDRHVVCHAPIATITIHDAATGREVAKVKSDTHPEAPLVCLQSPNGQRLVTLVTSGRYPEEDAYVGDVNLNPKESAASQGRLADVRSGYHIGRLPICGFEVWSAADGRKMWRVERPERERRAFVFSPDRRRNATWYAHHSDRGTYEAEFFEFETGKRIAVMPLKAHGEGCFSEDGELFLFQTDGELINKITMFDVTQGRVLWERDCGAEAAGLSQYWFVGDSHQLLHASNDPRRLEVLNPETGEPAMILSKDFPWHNKMVNRQFIAFDGIWERPKLLPDLPWLVNWWPAFFGQRNHALAVADLATGQEQIRVLRSSVLEFSISEDGQTLITIEPRDAAEAGDELRDIHVWDVQPKRAYFWSIAWPLLIGSALLLLRRWQANRKPAAASQTVSVTREGPVS